LKQSEANVADITKVFSSKKDVSLVLDKMLGAGIKFSVEKSDDVWKVSVKNEHTKFLRLNRPNGKRSILKSLIKRFTK
jgi:hypothetical protein